MNEQRGPFDELMRKIVPDPRLEDCEVGIVQGELLVVMKWDGNNMTYSRVLDYRLPVADQKSGGAA